MKRLAVAAASLLVATPVLAQGAPPAPGSTNGPAPRAVPASSAPIAPARPTRSDEVVIAPIDLSDLLPATPARGQALSPALIRARPRYWVQVSSLADPARLPAEWRRVRGAAGSTIKGQSAYVHRAGGMNRLLIGPFASEGSARQMVGKLKARRVSSIFIRTPVGADLIPLG